MIFEMEGSVIKTLTKIFFQSFSPLSLLILLVSFFFHSFVIFLEPNANDWDGLVRSSLQKGNHLFAGLSVSSLDIFED